MKSLLQKIFKTRIIRYGIVGGIGIPINDFALYVFLLLLSFIFHAPASSLALSLHTTTGNILYPPASALAFEVSTTVNFVLNQLFTYSEQKLHGREWLKRAGKAQLTSLSAWLLSYVAGLILVYVFHVSYYLANPAGIIIAFIYNYFISKKLVFRPTNAPVPAQETEKTFAPESTDRPVESTPQL